MFWVGVSILAVGTAYAALVVYVQMHLSLGPSNYGPEERAKLAEDIHQIEAVASGVKAGKIPWRTVDYRSIGFPEQEAKLLQLRRWVDAFEVKFHRLPASVGDFSQLAASGDQRRRFRRFASQCQIVALESESYILNCSEWKFESRADLDHLVGSFPPATEKFYLVWNHVILYVPPFVSNRPLRVTEPDREK